MKNGSAKTNQTNLMVNHLPQLLTDEEFRSMFLCIGPLNSCKVMRDEQTGNSYGFGFADFKNPEDASRAIQILNGLHVENKRIKVTLAQQSEDDTKNANVYIKNLPKSYTETELNEVFEPFGKIIQSRVMIDLQTKVSKCVGFVLYETQSEAEKAISEMNNIAPPGGTIPLVVKFADDNSKKTKPPPQVQQPYPSLGPRFPNPGPMRSTPAVNRFRYNPMGSSASLMGSNGGHIGSGSLGGYGYAASNYNENSSGNYNSTASSPTSPPQPSPGGGYTIYAYNIGNDTVESEMWALFSQYGTVSKVNVMWDHDRNKCKGYGFVTMPDLREALNAINCLNGYQYKTRTLSVSFKK